MQLLSQQSKELAEKNFRGPKVKLDEQRLSIVPQRQHSVDIYKNSIYLQSNDYVEVAQTPNAINTARNNRVTRRMLTRRKKEEVNQKLVDNQVFKTLAKDRLVKQFKRHLFLKSYVMSQEYKGIIQSHFKYEQNSSKRVEFNSQTQDKQIFLIPGSKVTLILDLLSLMIKILQNSNLFEFQTISIEETISQLIHCSLVCKIICIFQQIYYFYLFISNQTNI